VIYERVGQHSDALARYKRAMEIDSGNAQYVVAAAEMLINQRRLDEAESLLTERRQFLQYNPALRQTMGHIATLRGDHRRAVELYREALLLAPGDPAITEDLIQAHMFCAQFADAESLLGKLLAKDDNKARRDLKSLRARCLMALDRPVDARTILQDLTTDAEGSADLRAWIDLGNVAAILKDRATLRQCSQRVVAMAPDRFEGHLLRAMNARLDNRPDNALQAADQAIARSGQDVSPYVFKAIVLQDQQRFAEARDTLARAQQIDPSSQQVAALKASVDKAFAPAPETIGVQPGRE
jgi:tetratricopeptide (TPR) repeat protein